MKKTLPKLIAAILITLLIMIVIAIRPTFSDLVTGFDKLSSSSTAEEQGDSFFKEIGNRISENIQWSEPKEENPSELAEAEEEVTEELPLEVTLVPVTLQYVIDGDTIIVSEGFDEFKVRLIGINTEESVAAEEYYKENNEWGKQASDYTKSLLEEYKGNTIYLEYDVQISDDYLRKLAYVWLNEDTDDINNMLQVQILKSGYAEVMKMEPNTKYASEFQIFYEEAVNNHIGLWADDTFREFKEIRE